MIDLELPCGTHVLDLVGRGFNKLRMQQPGTTLVEIGEAWLTQLYTYSCDTAGVETVGYMASSDLRRITPDGVWVR